MEAQALAQVHQVPVPAHVVAGVRLLTLALPSGPTRNRYRLELLGELAELPVPERTAYLARLATRVPALALAVQRPRRVVLAADAPFYPSVRCRLHLGHRWADAYTPDGHKYLRCRHCGTDRQGTNAGSSDGMWLAGNHVMSG